MNRISLITQASMILIAVAIGFLYIKPKVTTIRLMQDVTSSYQVETDNVSEVNAKLKTKVAEIDAISPQNILALSKFMPDQLDEIVVLKDITHIMQAGSVKEYDVSYGGNNAIKASNSSEADVNKNLIKHYFGVSFQTDYRQFKKVLSLFEVNNYVFQIENLTLTSNEDSLLTVDIDFVTYSRSTSTEKLVINDPLTLQ